MDRGRAFITNLVAGGFGLGWESRGADVGAALLLPIDGRELIYDGLEGRLL